MVLTEEKKRELFKKISQSQTFHKSPASIALLRYLIEKNIEGTDLKEGIIEIEFYGDPQNSSKSTPQVRVNVYNLRKKLKCYYEAEGHEDDYRIVIAKGQYNLTFIPQNSSFHTSPIPYRTLIPYTLITLLLSLLIFLSLPAKKPYLWKSFLTNKRAITLFVGDAFGMIKTIHTGKLGWVTDFNIHNIKDYYQFIQEHPAIKDSIKPASYTYINEEAAIAARDLTTLLAPYKKTFNIQLASKTQYNDITAGNMVYVGSPLKEKFINMFNEDNPYCTYKNDRLIIEGHPTVKDTSMYIHSGYAADNEYALVGRMPGPQGTEQFFFFSRHEIGNMGTFRYFTNRETLKTFAKEKLDGKSHFVALYRVFGKERVDMKIEEVLVIPF